MSEYLIALEIFLFGFAIIYNFYVAYRLKQDSEEIIESYKKTLRNIKHSEKDVEIMTHNIEQMHDKALKRE